ncbi:hypothetical protein N7532_011292 [Penicillium argentinense]|uniref:Nephrocystin 3-like N-terminal domain-containing protein n=1 Tax=Penicillium argentinense TaxID=1131581 RepID=A0A9W9EI62_9EURO|nr:uncharacterized protein N7532_011292 [Penicillium argentinense]KAJ5082249.1 hypothetical protein N7532_011292 [Penicillium argentinense]
MAPGIISPVPGNITSPSYSSLPGNSRHVSTISSVFESDNVSNNGRWSRRDPFMPRKVSGSSNANMNRVAQFLHSHSSVQLRNVAFSDLLNTDYYTITDWIRHERMSYLPPAGSSYDKVLSWAEFFVDRLKKFVDDAIHEDSYLVANLAYGSCGLLLELGKENKKNAEALMVSFGFFYNLSAILVNLIERAELFAVSVDISNQLATCLSHLVTLVANVARTFNDKIRSRSGPVSVDIYDTFDTEIRCFRASCDSIAEAMWHHQLSRESSVVCKDVKSIRSWLAPEDRVLSHIAENSSHLAHDREEMTCQWVDQYLAHFLKGPETIMSFYGKPGSGKTVLASVIVDILQKVIGGVSYQTLFVPINARIPAETSPTAIAKTILFQLFEKRIGNVGFLQSLSNAYERSRKITDVAEYEDILWSAVEDGLAATLSGAKQLVIVVDGLDEASCPEQVLFKRLTAALDTAVNMRVNVKLITFGAEKHAASGKVMNVPVNEDRINDDISIVVRNISTKKNHETFNPFNQISEMEQVIIINQITEASQGSFQWAKLCTKRVRLEQNPEAMMKVVETLVKDKPSVADFVADTLSQPGVTEEARYMLLWLATADRPLVLKELTALASIQVDKQTVTDRKVNPLEVLSPLVSLVFLQADQVCLRHGLIRTAVLDVFSKGKLIPAIKDRHLDLVTRLLIYIKNTVTERHEPTLDQLHSYETLLSRNPLLDFAVRSWPYYLRQTNVYTTGGVAPTAKEFSKLFPVTVTLLLLQTALWQNISTPKLVSFQTTVTNLTRQILTTDNLVTLQSIITLALMHRDIGQIPEATTLVYELTTITRKILTERSIVTMQVANTFLELTDCQKTGSKTDFMVKREEIFKLVIKCYAEYYGPRSDQVVTTYHTLIEHYRLTKEETKIREIEVIIQKITGEYGADQTNVHGELPVTIGGRQPEPETSGIPLDPEVEHDEVDSDAFDSQAHLKQAEKFTAEGNITEAERIYVKIWQRASDECRIQYSGDWEEIKLNAVLVYTQFLRSQKRETEVSSILSSVAEDYRHSSLFVSESSASRFQEIAKVMTDVGLSAAALNILRQVAHYYKSTKSSSYSVVEQHIQSVFQRITREASSSSWTAMSESVLQEFVYELYQSGSKIDQSSFTVLHTLVEKYTSQHRWKDTTRVIKKILRTLWPSLFSPSVNDMSLPTEHTNECVSLARRLSQCYQYRRRSTREERIRYRVYFALRAAKPVDDRTRNEVTNELVAFYGRSSQPDRVISTRQEVLGDETNHYGPEHPVVINTLKDLADLTRPRPIFVEYYQRVIKALNKDSPHCHPDAIEPLVMVVNELWRQSRYLDAVPYYSVLFSTFLVDPKKFQDTAFVQDFFTRYIQCLRNTGKDYTSIHTVTTQYRTKVKAVYGATAKITINATLTLAKLSQETKFNQNIAIELYKELLNIQSNEIEHNEIQATLDGIYEDQAAILHSSSASSEDVNIAMSVFKKRSTIIRQTHGWASEMSLSKLEEIVSFHAKQKDTSSVLSELHESTFNILLTESSSSRLISAATVIAGSYIATEQIAKATELTQEIYHQIVMKDISSKNHQFDLSSKGRQSLIFLAQLEHSLFKRTSTITDVLASLTTEYVYFEEFRSQRSSKAATFHSVSVSAAQLHSFLRSSNRESAAARVFDDYVAYFLATEGKRIKLTDPAKVKILLSTLLKHFSTYQSSNFIRSIGIASNHGVLELLKEKNYGGASDLASAAFHYISADDAFRNPAILKFVFTLGVHTGRTIILRPDQAAQKLVDVSCRIIKEVLRVCRDQNIDLAQIRLEYLNILIRLLGEQKSYEDLAWLLSGLWNSRNKQGTWSASIILQLARRYIMASYLNEDGLKASRLAENIVYNCRRVNGPCHASTLQMSVLLSQLYTGIAQKFQSIKGGQNMASNLYRKSAALHEYLLRVFVDPSLADFDGGLENSLSLDGSVDLDFGGDSTDSASAFDGMDVCQHLQLLKLAVQRLGDWPKDRSEFERLYKDLQTKCGGNLEGVEEVEKWNLKSFGSGKAAGNEDILNLDFKTWELEIKPPDEIDEGDL